MTGQELLLILGGILVGFSLGDAFHMYRNRNRPTPPRHHPVVNDWDQVRHVTIIKDGPR